MKAIKEIRSNDSKESDTEDGHTSTSVFPRILSGSIGSIVTALAVTPLEVVKIRQQLSGADVASRAHNTENAAHKIAITPQPCPRGCTVVLNNGLMECVVPKSSIFEAIPFSRSFNPTQQTFLPRYNGGTLHTLSSIVHYEGVSGLYAGLRPTLLMSVPNTVLYFTVYDEISLMLRRNHVKINRGEETNVKQHNIDDSKRQLYIPLIAGSTARLLASLATAPLELIRTRQASAGSETGAVPGMIQEFRYLLRTNGLSSLYVGLAPTLWRDVPFSAVYWMCLERFKNEMSNSEYLGKWGGKHYEESGVIPAQIEALHAFVSGAVAGSIAATLTTPFDVVKTRRQILIHAGLNECKSNTVGYGRDTNLGILGHMQQIVRQEGFVGLWKGNTTRMVKVAPACAIMISVYEFGKRAFGDLR